MKRERLKSNKFSDVMSARVMIYVENRFARSPLDYPSLYAFILAEYFKSKK